MQKISNNIQKVTSDVQASSSKKSFLGSVGLLPAAVGALLGVLLTMALPVVAERGPYAQSEMALFTEVMEHIKKNYVEDVDDATLINNAIRGMVSSLDPHSAFFSSEELTKFTENTSGKFGGLGIEVQMQDGYVKVVAPIDDTPAQRAGMMAGDLIISLDGKQVKGMTLQDAVGIMRGDPQTDIVLTVVREGVAGPFDVTITRDIIKVKSVKSRLLEPNMGYVRVSQFQQSTGAQMREAIDKLTAENNAPLQGLVLDLRNNPGGVLGQSIAVADAFLNEKLVVYTQGRSENSRTDFNGYPGDVLNNAPLVVLVNSGSASASEIVAGALQDHKRGIIMGTTTFGKGSVQTLEPLASGDGIKVTTALYYTPNGRSIQAKGIVPDVLVEPLKLAKSQTPGFTLAKEADLTGRLDNGNDANEDDALEAKADKAANESEDDDAKKENLATDDYQLFEALNLLKGMSIYRSTNSTSIF